MAQLSSFKCVYTSYALPAVKSIAFKAGCLNWIFAVFVIQKSCVVVKQIIKWVIRLFQIIPMGFSNIRSIQLEK